ncbi:MAG: GNAT family N-acetyltransferase [Oscillospiraceae bacterium]|nr:GNAT family N-acetyltransferase [Oscillospiraceae bacterium]
MKYRNAAECLPAQLLRELQRHTPGELLYVPAVRRQPWGEGTGAKALYARRNAEIRGQYRGGQADVPALCETHCLSDETVRKIIYTKGEASMSTNEIDYSKYYWQNDLVRIRRARPDDWKHHNAGYNSAERFFTDCEQELPTSEEGWRESWENYIKSRENDDTWICLAIETLDGGYMGGCSIHGIDERNGTFGIFLGTWAEDKRHATAALRLLLDYAFNERRLNKCSNYFMDGDMDSMAVYEAVGFKKEGVKRQQVFHRGRYWDEHHYGLLAEEFNRSTA